MPVTLWSSDNDARLRELWTQPVTREAIGAEFGISPTAVCHRARRLGLPHKRPANRPCTQAADAVLARLWAEGASSRQIAREIGVNKSVVLDRAKRLGLPSRAHKSNAQISRSRWTPAQDEKLRDLWAGPMHRSGIARILGVGLSTLDARARRLGLPRRQQAHDWTAEQDAMLRDNWSTLTIAELAARISVTIKVVRHRAEVLAMPPKPEPPRKRRPKAVKQPKARKQRVVATVFVAPRAAIEIHDSASAAERLDAKMARAIESLRKGKDPVGIACGLNIPLREVYRLRGEMRAA